MRRSMLAIAMVAACGGDPEELAPDAGDDPEAPDGGGAPDAPPPLTEGYTAIVDLGGCSASVVRYATSQLGDDALVLTNGHCIGGDSFLGPGEAIAGQPSNRPMRVLEPDALQPGPPTDF